MSKIVFPVAAASYDTANTGPRFFALAGTPDAMTAPTSYSATANDIAVPTTLNSNAGALWIMSGTRPSGTTIESYASSTTFKNAYAAQKLLEYRPLSYTLRPATELDRYIITYSYPNVVNAVLSGTATWWAVGDYYSSGIIPYFVGDVSNMAGAGEVKLANTAIVSGNGYLLSPFSFCISATVQLS